jgi:hypothetical protein
MEACELEVVEGQWCRDQCFVMCWYMEIVRLKRGGLVAKTEIVSIGLVG